MVCGVEKMTDSVGERVTGALATAADAEYAARVELRDADLSNTGYKAAARREASLLRRQDEQRKAAERERKKERAGKCVCMSCNAISQT